MPGFFTKLSLLCRLLEVREIYGGIVCRIQATLLLGSPKRVAQARRLFVTSGKNLTTYSAVAVFIFFCLYLGEFLGRGSE